MKQLFKFTFVTKAITLITLLITNGATFAVNPVQGLYAGISLGASYMPTTDITFIPPTLTSPTQGTVKYSVLGNIAGQFGYRYKHVRIEGELLANASNYKTLKTGTTTYNTTYKWASNTRMKGKTNTGAFMVNGFYDFFSWGEASSFWAPYVGLGLGYAYVQNNLSFDSNNILIPGTSQSESATTPAAQGVIGLGYFLDDFAYVALDLRRFTTQAVQPFNSRVQITSMNLTFNGAFDLG